MQDKNSARVIAAGAVGNILEWYDFAIYGYFAAQIGRSFFPHEDVLAQILSAFGIFAIGYLARPLGGLLIGRVGDRFGRKHALTLSIAAMAIPTFLVGILPGYATLGVAAPIALTVLRLVQGLSVGGEYTTSLIFMVEHASPRRRGLVGSLACCGAVSGMLLGSATGAVLAGLMPSAALEAWGWRLPFLLGLPIGLIGLWLRKHLPETHDGGAQARSVLREVVVGNTRLLGWLAALSAFNAVGFYLSFVYLVSWMQFADHLAPARALDINSVSMLALIVAIMGFGWLSDHVGRGRLIVLATILAIVFAIPLFWVMHHSDGRLVLLGQLGLVVIMGMFLGEQPTVMVEHTPPAIRCTAIALGYNLCLGIVGGLTPMVATWLVRRTQDDLSPAFLIMAAASVSLFAGLAFMRRRAVQSLA